MIVMQRNFKFRLYPTQQQHEKLQDSLDACRWVYNKFIKSSRNGFLTRNDMNYMLTELKESNSWLSHYHSKMLQMVSTQVDSLQKSLLQLRKNECNTGTIKFARYNEYRAFIYNQSGFDLQRRGSSDFLWLSKIGFIEIRKHRELMGNIKQIIISKSKSGKWHAILTCNIEHNLLPKINLRKVVGIDLGIRNFVCDSQWRVVSNPTYMKKLEKPLAKIRRKIMRRHTVSNNRKKVLRRYQIIHERIANRRKNFLHKLSTYYAKNNDIVFVEKLAKPNMMKNKYVAKCILDSGWGTFYQMLKYKCKMLVDVNPKNTSLDCSRCGHHALKSLAVRTHRCNACGLIMDRDYNASINILKKGLETFGIMVHYDGFDLPQELREVTPVEMPVVSKKQEDITGQVQ